ncbi:SusC/RagA family TonB-linked outer membrane protein [Capnocytophaga stomatis]|uniref:SusC/RagA family TonB-linked outer membrane protein n=1 Tax=Capnocytophaga stomatis TaxID=1848904 RepID=UPI00195202CD|nr:SusC/RagA family TonB-linked outer membrane protein [Capnocytophaga stomatis]GIJ96656.1 SusC/RagA family TonB-linked outer membrane protein [Capnocytophaga stomatis]
MINLLRKSGRTGTRWILLALLTQGFWTVSASEKIEATSTDILVQQQTKKVSGTVTDASGVPLPGVSVLVKGTSVGVATDFDGNFEINVPEDKTDLVFSYIGFKEQTIKVSKSQSGLKIVLREEVMELEGTVVTALGIKRQEKALSYNVQQVKSEELTKVKETNIVNSLNGKVAGVSIQRSASGIGGATKVVMRGLKSIDGNNGVLYVIDGVPMFNRQRDGAGTFARPRGGESIADINPEDVESINVLTGPSAAALYGSQAANGVILINTKKGKEGKMEVNVSSSVEMITPTLLPKFQDTYGSVGQKSWGEKLSEPSGYKPSKFFNTGTNVTNAVTLSTGTKQNQTFVSAAKTDAKGVIPNSDYYRTNVSVRNTSSFLDDKLHLDVSGAFVRQGNRNMISGGGYFNPLVALYLMPRSIDYRDIEIYERYNPQRGIYEKYQPYPEKTESIFSENPYWVVNRELFLFNKKRYMMSASLKYDILDWLNVTGRVRLDNDYGEREEKLYASTTNLFVGWKEEYGPYNKGFYSINNSKDEQTYADIMLNANKSFGEDYTLTANLGASYNDQYNTGLSGGGLLLNVPNLFSSSNFAAETGVGQSYFRTKNVAVFASAELGYKRMLYLSLTGRNDWSSQLVNSSEPSFFYPSVGLSAVVSEMLQMPEFVDFVKVRGSYTEVGSPISKTGITPGTITHSFESSGIKANSTYPYPDFKAERTRSIELGLNTKFFKNSLSVDLTLYKSNTYNQLLLADLSASAVYSNYYLQAGNVENKGIELAVTFQKDLVEDFNWSSTITYSHNDNKIRELARNYLNPFTGERFDITETKKGGRTLREGESMSDIVVKGVLARDVEGNLIEEAATFKVDKTQEIRLGRSTPDFQMGWRNTFSYKGFDLSVLFNGSFGGVVLSGTQPYLDAYGVSKASADARDAGGVLVNGKLYDPEKYYNTIRELSGYYAYDATNVRLQEASLNYTLDGKVISNQIKRITFGVIGTNLWMIYNKAPFDPQLSFGVGTYTQTELFMAPAMKTYGLSLKLQF